MLATCTHLSLMKKKRLFINKTKKYFSQFPERLEFIDKILKDNPKWVAILRARIMDETFTSLAADYKVSKARISQLEIKAIHKIQRYFSKF